MKKLQWMGPGVYRGADEARSTSLTVRTGEVVEVSDKKATELIKDKSWKAVKPEKKAAAEKE